MALNNLIQYRNRIKQIIDFSNLRFGSITPTDIDALIEYHGLGYIFIELKLRGMDLPIGQKLALERLIDDLNKIKPSVGIICNHCFDNPHNDIDMANTLVSEYRFDNQWKIPKCEYTAKEFIAIFLIRLDNRYSS